MGWLKDEERVRHNSFEVATLRGGYFDDDPGTYRTDPHADNPMVIYVRNLPSRSIREPQDPTVFRMDNLIPVEGIDEILTINRLGPQVELRRSLASTNGVKFDRSLKLTPD